MPRRILIVDDHVAVRQGLERIVLSAFPGAEVGAAGTTEEVLAKVDSGHFTLVILDLSLPGRGGLELISQIKTLSPATGILIYTGFPDDHLGLRCLRLGADGYVTKDRPVDDLIKAIERVDQGRKWVSDELAEILAQSVATNKTMSIDSLSERELQVLRLLAKGDSPTQIGADLHLSVKTVSTYRARLLEKLGLETTADLIRFAIENGL
jgi:DNA-binding NarL/FixJ family response regulator